MLERLREGRGWGALILATVVTVIVGGSLAAYGVIRYAPLNGGSTFQAPPGSVLFGEPTSGDEPSVYKVRYSHGAETSFSFTVQNRGRWSVTIVDLPILHQTSYQLLKMKRATISNTDERDRAHLPFAKFALKAGEERLITLHGVFSDCERYVSGSGNLYEAIQVRYQFSWMTREASIPMTFQVHVISPPDSECPRPRPPDIASPTTSSPTASPTRA